MKMNLSREEIRNGEVQRKMSKETPNTFAVENGAAAPVETKPLDKTANRKAGYMGQRARELMEDPIAQDRTKRWMYLFGMTVPGAEFNAVKMEQGMPPV